LSEPTKPLSKSATSKTSVLSRVIVLAYGLISYLLGVAGLAALILMCAQLLPVGLLNGQVSEYPMLWNFVLVAIWGTVHSVMARNSFKLVLTKLIPEPAERPTYVLIAGITSILLVGFWQPVEGIVWSVSQPMLVAFLWGLFAFGWVYLLGATFAINHFDLFGLRQVYFHFQNQSRPQLKFIKRAMYQFSRHPIQTGVLIGVWATPVMTMTQLGLSVGFTAYIFIGLWFEEKDLIADIGEPYEQYRRETGMFLPKLFKRDKT
jgi:protein-S-isoprenylcysteine O-methyltransferase Ste14